MLYLLISNHKYMKVGYTSDEFTLKNRMMAYLGCNPDIVLIGTIEGDLNTEKQFHKMKNYVPIRYTKEFAPIHKDILRRFINDKTFVERNIDDVLNYYKSSIADMIHKFKETENSMVDLLKEGIKNCDYKRMIYEKRDLLYMVLGIEIGKVYLISDIRNRIRDAYADEGIKIRPKITDLFIVKQTTMRDGNKVLGAYKILGRKYE